MLVRRETADDVATVDALTASAFGRDLERRILAELRATDAWLPSLSLVARVHDGIAGHVAGTRAHVAGRPVLALGPLSVDPAHQRRGVGSALVHALLGAADALGEPVVVLLGDPGYYARFGFVLASTLHITPPRPEWAPHLQARALTAYTVDLQGEFAFAAPFMRA